MSLRARAWLLLLAAAVPACARRPLTQIVVMVDSDYDGFDRVKIAVDGFERAASVTAKLSDQPLPRRVALVHEGGPLGPIAVTVSAFTDNRSTPWLVEPRTKIYFQSGKTLMLKVDLLYDCVGACDEGQACVAGPICESASAAAKLSPWTGGAHALNTAYHVDAGDVLGGSNDGGPGVAPMGDGGADAGGLDANVMPPGAAGDAAAVPPDAANPGVDAGPVMAAAVFAYAPANFDPQDAAVAALPRQDVVLDCGTSGFDSSDLSFSNWCGPQPAAMVIKLADGSDAALLAMSTLSLRSGATLALTGSLPVIMAVYGDAHIEGSVDASAHGTALGPGADRGCSDGAGSSGPAATGNLSAGGGSGGGFGSPGGAGGAGGSGGSAVGGGKANGSTTLEPLRGGCSGGHGGTGGSGSAAVAGAAGGALQISAAGKLFVPGAISANGGGGGAAASNQYGGGGGGSGGAILLEGATVGLEPGALVSANGGSGGAGQPYSGSSNGEAGTDGIAGTAAAPGGAASGSGGAGGAGAALAGPATAGADGSLVFTVHGAGGGGGGGVGRIAVRQASSCAFAATFSPLPVVSCASCGACPVAPALGCALLDHLGTLYLQCTAAMSWQNARASCQNAGFELAHVRNAVDNEWLASQLAAESWLGGSTAAGSSSWSWIDDGSAFWSGGSSGGAVGGAFTAWSSTSPSSSGLTSSRCLTLGSDAQWRDHSCSSSYAYVCQQP